MIERKQTYLWYVEQFKTLNNYQALLNILYDITWVEKYNISHSKQSQMRLLAGGHSWTS